LTDSDFEKALESSSLNTDGIAYAIEQLPMMKVKKAMLDKHTFIATSIVTEINERDIVNLISMEQEQMTQSRPEYQAFVALLSPSSKASPLDKLRLLMIYYLCNEVSDSDLQDLILLLEGKKDKNDNKEKENKENKDGKDKDSKDNTNKFPNNFFAPLLYLKKWKGLNKMITGSSSSSKPGPGSTRVVSAWGKIASKVIGKGADLLSTIKNLLPTNNKDLPLTRIVDSLMTNKETADTEKYLYLDPKLSKGKSKSRSTSSSQSSSSSSSSTSLPLPKDCFVFVLGGGNYSEFQDLQDYARKNSNQSVTKTITYGSTEIVSPSQFVAQLTSLGKDEPSQEKKQNDISLD